MKILKRYILGLFVFYTVIIILFLVKQNSSKYDKNIQLDDIVLKNQFGELKSISDYKGKVILMDFWFAGCTPCLKDMKYFPQLLNRYKEDLVIMSVTIDPESVTQKLLSNKKKPWDFLIANNPNWTFYNNKHGENFIKRLNITNYPTYLLFNKKGELISTPISAIYGVENELSGLFSLKITIEKNIKTIALRAFKFLFIYTFLFGIAFFISKYIKGKHNKTKAL